MDRLTKLFSKASAAPLLNLKLVRKAVNAWTQNPKRASLLLLTAISLLLFLTRLGNLVVFTLVAVVYPFNQSMRAVSNNYYGEISKWLVYWFCFAFFYVIQYLVHVFFEWRDYNLLVVSLVLYLIYCPHMNLTEIVYDNMQGVIIKKFFDLDPKERQKKVLQWLPALIRKPPPKQPEPAPKVEGAKADPARLDVPASAEKKSDDQIKVELNKTSSETKEVESPSQLAPKDTPAMVAEFQLSSPVPMAEPTPVQPLQPTPDTN